MDMSNLEQEPPTAGSPALASKAQRVLACVRCQQRKVRCDRTFPCANCTKSSAQCIPAILAPRQRRRRFAERDVLDRVRYLEDLLRQHKIQFDPLHSSIGEKTSPSENDDDSLPLDDGSSARPLATRSMPSSSGKETDHPGLDFRAKSIKDAVNQELPSFQYEDDMENSAHPLQDHTFRSITEKAWENYYTDGDNLLFGLRRANVNVSTLHPGQIHIFKLWQIYLENVNPILKVTHAPTLQAQIIDAASDVASIAPTSEALMFGIYSIAVLTLDDEKCRATFGSPRQELLTSYQFACQQALLNCGFLRSAHRDSLTALYLFLISIRPATDPRSLSALFGVATRIAQRMGIHIESTNAEHDALEAEMRRRLWWSMSIFDNRICELHDYKTTNLTPAWDCQTPLNANDFDFQPEMKIPPTVHEEPTEAIFAVVRSELSDFIRHSSFHLDFTNPALKEISKSQHHVALESDGLSAMQRMIEEKYLGLCNPENPVQFLTIWSSRGYIAKLFLLQYFSKAFSSRTDDEHDAAVGHALIMLDCDTKIMSKSVCKGFVWHSYLYFPWPAYKQAIQDLKRRPYQKHAKRAWDMLSDNFQARFSGADKGPTAFIERFSEMVLEAWDTFRASTNEDANSLNVPPIVSFFQRRAAQPASEAQGVSGGPQPDVSSGIRMDDLTRQIPLGDSSQGSSFIPTADVLDMNSMAYSDMIDQQALMDRIAREFDWNMTDWDAIYAQHW